jgi:AraC-like DNA-binding protein/mannose-6-phosphate isomerase-like protein (cupin superfamily)
MSAATKHMSEDYFRAYKEPMSDSEKLLSHLNIEVVSANGYECSEKWDLAPRRVNDSYWTWIISGQGSLVLGDDKTKYMVGKGDFILFPQYCLHSLKPEPGSTMSMINVHFHARFYGILDMLAHYDLGGVYKNQENGLFEINSYESAREYSLKPTGWQRSLAARIELVLMDILRSRKSLPAHKEKIARLQPVLTLIESELANPNLSVADMATEMDVSEVYLRTLFRRQFGISPIKYLRRQRIDRACSFLRETVIPIRIIAEKCGFREVQFFHRVFRDMTGITPGEYRKNPDF